MAELNRRKIEHILKAIPETNFPLTSWSEADIEREVLREWREVNIQILIGIEEGITASEIHHAMNIANKKLSVRIHQIQRHQNNLSNPPVPTSK